MAGHPWQSLRFPDMPLLFRCPEITKALLQDCVPTWEAAFVWSWVPLWGPKTCLMMKWSLASLPGDNCAHPWQGAVSALLAVKFLGLFCVTLDLGETTCKGKINGKALLSTAWKIFSPFLQENREECQLSGLERSC